MNIHFTDKELFESLKSATIAKVVVGSHMYGTNHELSDTDYLYIYATSENELFSAILTHHQLQYKENNIDYNFVSLHTFIRNILNGDSTINFETVHSTQLIGSDLEFLYNLRQSFITYTMIRSYLGICRRDLKHYHKCKTDAEKIKKLRHIIRGYIYARDMLYNQWNFDLANTELKSIALDISTNKQLRQYESAVSGLRDELNERLNSKTLGFAQTFDVESGKELTDKMIQYCKSDRFKSLQNNIKDFDMNYFINSFENWVEY